MAISKLSIELLLLIARNLNLEDYNAFRSICKYTRNIGQPVLLFHAYVESTSNNNKKKPLLDLEYLDDFQFIYISKKHDTRNILRALDIRSSTRLSRNIFQQAFDILVASRGPESVLLKLLECTHVSPSIFTLPACISLGYTELFTKLVLDKRVQLNALDNLALKNAISSQYVHAAKILLSYPSVQQGSLDDVFITCIEVGEAGFLEDLLHYDDGTLDKTLGLRIACELGHTKIVEVLLEDTVNINAGAYQNMCIRHAADEGHLEIVQILLKRADVDVSALNNEAFQNACQGGHLKIIKLLLQYNKVDPSDMNSNAIRLACLNGHREIVKILLDDGRSDPSKNDNECLKSACLTHPNVSIVKMLLKHPKVDPKCENSVCLRRIAVCGSLGVAKLLLEDGRADLKANNFEAIQLTMEYWNIELCMLMLLDSRSLSFSPIYLADSYAKSFGIKFDDNDQKSLLAAAKLGWEDFHLLFIQCYSEKPWIDSQMIYCILSSCKKGYLRLFTFAVEIMKSDPTVNNNAPIKLASRYGHAEIVSRLLKLPGVDPSANKCEAIKLAMKNSHVDVLKLFLNDIIFELEILESIFRFALQIANPDIIELLAEHINIHSGEYQNTNLLRNLLESGKDRNTSMCISQID